MKTFFSVLLIPSTLCFAGSDPNFRYRLKSIFWRAYTADQDTLGLFHFDGEETLTDEELEEPNERVPEPLAMTQEPVSSGNLLDSGPLRGNASSEGMARLVAEGFIKGALRLKGGVLLTPPYPGLGKEGFTIECWFNPEGLPRDTVALFRLESKRRGHSSLELRYVKDGHLEFVFLEEALGRSKVCIEPGSWRHISLVAKPPSSLSILVNGQTDSIYEESRLRFISKDLSGVVRVGSKHGLNALIDELRISSIPRQYYEWEVAWTDPLGRREIASGRPYFRDERDLLFFVPFERSVEPRFSAERRRVQKEPSRPGTAEFRFRQGVHGSAILVGGDCAMPIYSASGNITAEQGAIEFWFRPWDWDNRKEQGFHDPMEYVPLIRLQSKDKNDILALGILHKKPLNSPPPESIHPGRWYHIVVNWRGRKGTIYLNGEPVKKAPSTLGSKNSPKNPPSSSLIPSQPESTITARGRS